METERSLAPPQEVFFGSGHGLIDINGDGFLDAILADQRLDNLEDLDQSVDSAEAFFVFLGDGQGNFKENPTTGKPYVFPTPKSAHLSSQQRIAGVGNMSGQLPSDPPSVEIPWTFANGVFGTLNDMNGDGLIDLLWTDPEEDKDGPKGVFTYFNLGAAFENWGLDTPTDWKVSQRIPHAGRTFVTMMQSKMGGSGLNQTITATDAIAENDVRLIDFDGDGRVDLFNPRPDSHTILQLGRGDGSFTRALSQSVMVLDGTDGKPSEKDLVREISSRIPFPPYPWMTQKDFIDVTGDGLADVIELSKGILTDDYGDHPLRLMKRVNNGRGLIIEVAYEQHNKRNGVIDNSDGDNVPNSFFVVKNIKRTNGLCVAPGIAIDNSCDFVTTQYRYKNMVFNQVDRRWSFRGFKSAFVISPPDGNDKSSTLESRYDYEVDKTGRLSEEILYFDNPTDNIGAIEASVRTIKRIKNIELPSTITLTSFAVAQTDTWECANNQSYDSCVALEPRSQRNEWVNVQNQIFVIGQQDDWLGSEEQLQGNKRVKYQPVFITDEQNHLLRTTKQENFVFSGNDWKQIGRTDTKWSPDFKTVESSTVFESLSGPSHTTKFTYDPIGNVLSTIRPNQAASGGAGLAIVHEYDDQKLFANKTTNELGHIVESQIDYGTGVAVQTSGPNRHPSDNSSEGTRIEIDGFGRTIQNFVMVDGSSRFEEKLVGRITFDDESIPAVVTTEQRTDFNEDTWVTNQSHIDGLGPCKKNTFKS